MTKIKYNILLIIVFSCNQWDNDYEITKDYFYSKFKLNDGFKISELEVLTFSDSNIPKTIKKLPLAMLV